MLEAPDTESWQRELRNAAAAPAEPETVRILALRIDFLENSVGRKFTGGGRFDLRRDEEARSFPVDPPPHDSNYFEKHFEALARYYDVMSGGELVLQWDIYPSAPDSAYHLGDTRKYGPWIWSNSNPDVFEHAIDLINDALVAADADPAIDFTRYERGPNKDISVILFHAGTDFQGDINQDSPWDIPSFNLYVDDPYVVQDSTVSINFVMVVPEQVSQDGFYGALNGVVTHEFGHQLGFDDLYDVTTGTPIVGAFSLMDSGNDLFGLIPDPADTSQVLSVRGMLPASLDPWHKARFFPEGVDLVASDTSLPGDSTTFMTDLPAVEASNRVLFVPLNLSEYLLGENRLWDLNGDSPYPVLKQDHDTGVILGPAPLDSTAGPEDLGFKEYDHLIPGQGLLLWHVDLKAIAAGLSVPYGGINIFYSRPGVGVIEADGIRDIGSASEEFLGGPYDPYYLGGYTCLGPSTVPSSGSNDGTPTGFTICALDSIGFHMRASVSSGRNPGGWPIAFSGVPADEGFLALDLDGDGARELLVASGQGVLAWHEDATPIHPDDESAMFVGFGRAVDQGLSGREDFAWPQGPGVLVAAVAGGTLWLMNGNGEAVLAWPSADPGALGDSLVTATPVVLRDRVLVGCGDGTIRAITVNDLHPVLGRVHVSSGAVRVLGAQDVSAADLPVFWAASDGEAGDFLWSATPVLRSWIGGAPGEAGRIPVSALALPASAGSPARFFFLWKDGTCEWREEDGTLLGGWPARLGSSPAGEAILCDADGDGVLETVVADRDGRVHAFGWNGVEEVSWPHSIWSEDDTDPPAQESGVRAIDVDGDGVPEICIHRADGIMLALDGNARNVAGWPHSTGTLGLGGPDWIPASAGYAPRLALTNAYGEASDGSALSALSLVRVPGAHGEGIGFFPVPGADQARTRVYPLAWIPDPKPAPGTLDEASLRLYPNPMRGNDLTVAFTLGRAAHITLELFDVTGRRIAVYQAEGVAGKDGNRIRFGLSSLPPGMYHVRFRAQGDGFRQELFRKLAVLR